MNVPERMPTTGATMPASETGVTGAFALVDQSAHKITVRTAIPTQ
jgi:hypothetical protein